MYSPKYAIQENEAENKRIIGEYPFATVIFSKNDTPESFHLPLFLEGDKLVGHMARANFAWKEKRLFSVYFKLAQSKPEAERRSVISALGDCHLSREMKKTLTEPS